MVKIKKFFVKNNSLIKILLSAITTGILVLIALHFLNIIDINFFLRFRYFILLLFPVVSFWFLLFFENQKDEMQGKIKNFLKKTFPIILILQILVAINFFFVPDVPMELIGRYGYVIFGAFLGFVLLLLWTHRKEVFLKKDEDIDKRKSLFFLILIIVFFTILKAPFFSTSFTGDHSMKYNAHVEPAIYMHENNDPFWSQRKYLSDPFENPQNIADSLGSPPLNEWGLLTMFKLFPNNSIELNTRIFTHILGVLILILSYIFFTGWLTKKQSLIITFLIAMNPIIQLTSFVTIMDSWLMIFTFLSLIFINKYIKEKNIQSIFWAGLFFGFGTMAKVSIFLWLFPIIFIILAFNSKKFAVFFKNILLILLLSLTPIIAFATSLRYLPQDVSGSLGMAFLWVLAFTGLFFLTRRFHGNIDGFFEKVFQKKRFITALGIVIVTAGIIFLQFIDLERYIHSFLTDAKIMFNIDMYIYMLNDQFKNYMTAYVFYFGILGLIILFLTNKKNYRVLLFSLVIGCVVYWFFASKSMFFHNYYTNIIMITFCYGAGMVVYFLSSVFKEKKVSIAMIFITLFILFPLTFNENVQRLGKENGVYYVTIAEFLKRQNPSEEALFIRPGTVHTSTSIISLYSGIPSFPGERLFGFKNQSLSDLNVEFVLVDDDDGFDYLNKVINSDDKDSFMHRIRREDIIQRTLDERRTSPTQEEEIEVRNNVDIIYRIETQLEYIATIEDIDIYRVRP